MLRFSKSKSKEPSKFRLLTVQSALATELKAGQKTGPTHFREGASTLQRFGSNDENAHVCIGIKYVCMYHHVSIGMTTPCSYRDRLSQKGCSGGFRFLQACPYIA